MIKIRAPSVAGSDKNNKMKGLAQRAIGSKKQQQLATYSLFFSLPECLSIKTFSYMKVKE
jgi:hypothetical protein